MNDIVMNKKSNIISTLNCKQPLAGVPIWEVEFHCWNKFSSKKLTIGKEFEQLNNAQKEKALYTNAEIFCEVADKLEFAAVTAPSSYWQVAPSIPAYFWLPEEARYKQIEILKEMACDNFLIIGTAGGILTIPDAKDYVSFSLKLYDNPGEIQNLAENTFNNGIETLKKLCDSGIDAVVLAADLADNRGFFLSPKHRETYLWPYLKKWVNQAQKANVYTILHTDGNVYDGLSHIAKSGLNGLQSIDPIAGMSISETRKITKRQICLCGNMDCGLLRNGTEEQIFNAAKDMICENRNTGCFVFGSSNAVFTDTPAQNYKSMLSAWQKYGKNYSSIL